MMMSAAATKSIAWRISTTTSKSTIWATPDALALALNQEFDFTIDVAAHVGNAKVDRFFDKDSDALAQSWAGERVFCNPPYGRDLGRWVEKAMHESQEHGALVVMVLPARTSTIWFHRYCLPHAEVRFLKGRLSFTLGGSGRSEAPFASMVVIFRPWQIGGGALRAQPTFPGFGRRV
jgi:phage N-6-adenine-methyltransferase